MPLSCREIDFAFAPARPVLRGVSAEFPAGAVTAIIGPNGAGKSTLLRLLLGVLRPAAGKALLDGHETRALSGAMRASALAYVPQRPSLWAPFSVRETVAFGRFALRADPASVEQALAATGLLDRAEDPFDTLSAGQQQRAALARALAQSAGPGTGGTRCILADEPCSAMDPRHAVESLALLTTAARRGLTVLIVLHDFTLARRVADWALVLDDSGRVDAFGPAAETLEPGRLSRVFATPIEQLGDGAGVALVPRTGPKG